MSANVDSKLYARVKSCESGYKLFELVDGTCINFRRGSESSTYNFDRVFSCSDGQTKLYQSTARKAVERMVDGFSSMVMCYGAPTSGKSYTLVGKQELLLNSESSSCRQSMMSGVAWQRDDPRSSVAQSIKNSERGLMLRCIDYLFEKAKHYENYKQFVVTASCLEINKEGIKDLGVHYHETGKQGYRPVSNTQRLFIQENECGVFQLPGMSVATFRNGPSFYEFMGRMMQEHRKAECHFIIQVNLQQTDKLHPEADPVQSSITFVELAFLSPSKEKEHEALLLQCELYSLAEVVRKIRELDNSRNLLRQSRLTKVLSNSFIRSSTFMLIGCLDLSNDTTSQSTATLNFVRRLTQSRQEKVQSSQVTLLQLKSRLTRQQRQYESLVEENRQKLESLYDFLGIDLKGANPDGLDPATIRKYKLAMERTHYLTTAKAQNDRLLQKLEQQLEQEVKLQQAEQRKFQQKKHQLQSRLSELNGRMAQGQHQQVQLYQQHCDSYERKVAELNSRVEPCLEGLTKTIELTSNMTQLLNSLTENKAIHEQAHLQIDRQQKEAYKRKIVELRDQREEALRALRVQYEGKKALLQQQAKLSQKKDSQQEKRQMEIRRTLAALLKVTEKQQTCLRHLQHLGLLPSGINLMPKKLNRSGVFDRISNQSTFAASCQQPCIQSYMNNIKQQLLNRRTGSLR